MLDVQIRKQLGGFSLDVHLRAEAPVTALVGPSGSGKTLTVRSIAGALRPDDGHVRLHGEALFDAEKGIDVPPQARGVGYVPQQYALFPHLDVRGNVGFGLSGVAPSERDRRVAEMLKIVDLAGHGHQRPRELSGGQQQRVALARALIVQPRLLLLDEPFAALDAPIRTALRAHLLELQRTLGFRALLVTHDPEDAEVLAGQTFGFDQGRVTEVSRT